jgi:hypothetical protein
MTHLSGKMVTLRDAIGHTRLGDREARPPRAKLVYWIFPPSITDRRLAGTARRTLECHPRATALRLVVTPQIADLWQSDTWPVMEHAP